MGKKKHRTWCDTCALYGLDVDRIYRTDYERYLSLYLNRTRSTCRQAQAIQLGIYSGLGNHIGRKMGLAWFSALVENDDEARLNFDRSRAQNE